MRGTPATLAGHAFIITEEGYGNPDTDLMMNCKKATLAGAKTALSALL